MCLMSPRSREMRISEINHLFYTVSGLSLQVKYPRGKTFLTFSHSSVLCVKTWTYWKTYFDYIEVTTSVLKALIVPLRTCPIWCISPFKGHLYISWCQLWPAFSFSLCCFVEHEINSLPCLTLQMTISIPNTIASQGYFNKPTENLESYLIHFMKLCMFR